MPNTSGVQSVDRAVDVLEILTDLGGEATLSEIQAATDLSLPTVHRILRTFVDRGYARQLPSRRYGLGPRLVRVGEQAGRRLGAGARPHLEALARDLGETVNLAMFDRDMVVYLAQASSPHSMRMFTEVGRRVYCHCTGVGKVVFAQLPDDAVREIVGRVGLPATTNASITDLDALLADLGKVRSRGYALDDGEQEEGVRCFAVPVPQAPIPMALSTSGPAPRVTDDFGRRAVPALRAAAERIADDLSPRA